MKAIWKKHQLYFKFKAGTSRGVLSEKDSYFIILQDERGVFGIGECSLINGLSIDDPEQIEAKLDEVCDRLCDNKEMQNEDIEYFLNESELLLWPAIRMGIETAYKDLLNGGNRIVFKNEFINGSTIPINGLIWMGSKDFMLEQIRVKIESGYKTIKIKIGAIDFETELGIIHQIRKEFGKKDITLRVDANGAFSEKEALNKLNQLSKYDLHSIEQPIKKGLWDQMAELCLTSPIPIALDEELIGPLGYNEKKILVKTINPQFLVLKPSLLGGFDATQEWIKIAQENAIDWWVTSA